MEQHRHKSTQSGIGRLTIVGIAAVAMTASFSVAARADDACHKVATAKYMQWHQPRIQREMTEHFADGRVHSQDAIFTDGVVYVLDGPVWNVGSLTAQQHRVRSPEAVAANMGLTDCEAGESVDMGGQHVTAYTYKSESLDVGASGKIWISDTTGLPLRDEMSPDEATAKWPLKMSADYTYGDSVVVPKGAELADFFRRNDGKQMLRDYISEAAKGFK